MLKKPPFSLSRRRQKTVGESKSGLEHKSGFSIQSHWDVSRRARLEVPGKEHVDYVCSLEFPCVLANQASR